MSKRSDDQYSDEDAERRRDKILHHMLNRPPQPHKPLGASKRKQRPANKGRVRKGKGKSRA